MTRDGSEPTPSVKTSQTAPMDEPGRRAADTAGPAPAVYGEPRGPRPPHFEILDKEEIARRARPGGAGEAGGDAGADGRYADRERSVGGFHSGMTTPETLVTTGDEQPRVVRRDDDGKRLPEDGDGRERTDR